MMELQNEICSVKILVDSTYRLESNHNKNYDFVYNLDNYNEYDLYKTLVISIDLFRGKKKIAMIGSYYSKDDDCCILEGEILTILQNDAITQLNVRDGSIIFHKEFETLGCNFGIYKITNGYIVYGEIDIIMLDLNFKIKWRFSGRDIFVSISGKKAFELGDSTIKLFDFNDDYYEIDFDGKLVSKFIKS